MKLSLSEKAIVLIDSLEGLEYKHKRKILEELGVPEKLFSASDETKDKIARFLGESRVKTLFTAVTPEYLNEVLSTLIDANVTPLTYSSDEYPSSLKEIDTYPLVLYAKGDKSLLKSNCFGIVGSRKCLPYATALAKDYSATLSKNGVTVVTGSAGGADKAAIDGALSGGGKVISVITGGIDHVYPEYNKSLVASVAEKGLVVSEQGPTVVPKPWMFPVRNRIIAGLSKGVLIVGGEKTSGARHTADYALEYGKDVYAFPYSLGIATGELNNNLIKNGAYLCDDVKDILDCFGIVGDSCLDDELEDDERLVFDCIKNGVCDVNALVEKTGLKMYELAPALSSLEIQGYVVKTAGNNYHAIK